MKKIIFVLCVLTTNVQAQNFMKIYRPTNPPQGYVEFCDKHYELCFTQGVFVRVNTSIENLIELDSVNRFVNEKIEPKSDFENYGVSELWTIPYKMGDCEDYALLKQKILLERGWPSSTLLLTVVKDENDQGHTILTARTSHGDYILDNKIKEILLWNQAPYKYIMRQSTGDPKYWYSLEDNTLLTKGE